MSPSPDVEASLAKLERIAEAVLGNMANSPTAASASTKGVITFLDVLGWKGIYAREKAPLEKMFGLIGKIAAAASRHQSNFSLEVRSISDTIVLYSTNVTPEKITAAVDTHGQVCAKAIAESMYANIPVRGATAVGEFDVKDNIYVGKAIDEAASWYESADWVGVHLTPSAMFSVDDHLPHWAMYEPPVKGMPRHCVPCVAWIDAWKETVPPGQDTRRQLLSMFSDMGPITPDFAMKFVNTLAYFDEITARQKLTTNRD
jgi:hypothetical protein